MNDDTNANALYTHYFNNNRSALYVGANTNQDYKIGIRHGFGSNWSAHASVFSDNIGNERNNGGQVTLTYRFGDNGKAPKIRTPQTPNPLALMHSRMSGLNTADPVAIKHLHQNGRVVTTQNTVSSKHITTRILDTAPEFAPIKAIVDNDTDIIIKDHGIKDLDGVKNIIYVLYRNGKEIKTSKYSAFYGLPNGTYAIGTEAEVWNPATNSYEKVENKNYATVTIAYYPEPTPIATPSTPVTTPTTPVRTPDVIKAEVEAYMATVNKDVHRLYRGESEYTFDLSGLPSDATITLVSLTELEDRGP